MSDGKVVSSKRKFSTENILSALDTYTDVLQQTLAGDNGAARKMLRRPVAADYM